MDIVGKTQKKVETSKKKLAKTIELKSYKKLAVNFLILTVNLIIIILYFSLSQVKVVIIPTKEDVTHSVTLPIKESASIANNELAIEGNITSIEVEHTQSFEVEATSEIPKTATGAVTIYNTTNNKNQTFVKNTRFKNAAGIEIKIEKQVQVSPNKQVTVNAYASEKGKTGEVKSDSGKFQVVALPYLKDKIYAEISEDFTGGAEYANVLTTLAFNNARKEVESALIDKAWKVLSESNGSLDSKADLALEIEDLSSTAEPDDENIDSFSITVKGTTSAFTYEAERAKEIVKQELIKKIPLNKILVDFKGEPEITIDKETLEITAQAKATIQQKIPEAALSQEDIVGMNEEEVQEHFTKITGIRNVQIDFWPFWVRSVPNMKDHIYIEIKR